MNQLQKFRDHFETLLIGAIAILFDKHLGLALKPQHWNYLNGININTHFNIYKKRNNVQKSIKHANYLFKNQE